MTKEDAVFRKSKEKDVVTVEESGAREAEVKRLSALPVLDLAEEIMPAFGPDGPGKGEVGLVDGNVINYLLASYPGRPKEPPELMHPVREGLQQLEHASLILVTPTSTFGGILSPTRLGWRALAEGTVRQYLTGAASVTQEETQDSYE